MSGYLQNYKQKTIQVMLHQENKLSIIILCGLLFLMGCSKYQKFNEKEINKLRDDIVTISNAITGSKQYLLLYNSLNDSINNWIDNHIPYIEGYNINRIWVLDSIICINRNGNKLITSVLKQSLYEGANADFIDYFYGVNISGTWYFFMGPHLVLPREFYQEDIHTPLSFEKLKQIATDNIYRGYLKKGKKGQWEINERFFSDITSVAWCTNCVTQEDWDNAYLSVIRENWAGKDNKSVINE